MTDKPRPSQSFAVGRLAVEVHATRSAMGLAAASTGAAMLRSILQEKCPARVIFACAPSQDEFLAELTTQRDLAWERVTAFHMDEYVGLARNHPASFRHYLHEHVTRRVQLARVHELAGEAVDLAAECHRYAQLLIEAPIDLV